MRRTNRIVALLLAGVMVAGSITGCSGSIKKKSAKLEKGDITDSSIAVSYTHLELAQVDTMNERAAKQVYEFFHNNRQSSAFIEEEK